MTDRELEVASVSLNRTQYVIRLLGDNDEYEAELNLSEHEAHELIDKLILLRLTSDAPYGDEHDKSDILASFVFPFSEKIETAEQRLQKHFCQWLLDNGWFVRGRFVGPGMDVHAKRDYPEQGFIQALIVECKADKGQRTGEHIDNAYGQLLRRISRNPIRDALAINVDVYYALVIQNTDSSINAARRVSRHLRELLRITVYAVDEAGQISEVTDDELITC